MCVVSKSIITVALCLGQPRRVRAYAIRDNSRIARQFVPGNCLDLLIIFIHLHLMNWYAKWHYVMLAIPRKAIAYVLPIPWTALRLYHRLKPGSLKIVKIHGWVWISLNIQKSGLRIFLAICMEKSIPLDLSRKMLSFVGLFVWYLFVSNFVKIIQIERQQSPLEKVALSSPPSKCSFPCRVIELFLLIL